MLIDKNEVFDYADYAVMMRREGYYTGYYGRTTPDRFSNEIKIKLGNTLHEAEAFSIDFYVNKNFDTTLISTLYDKIDSLLHGEMSSFCHTHFDKELPDGIFEYEILLSGIKEIMNEPNK